jgi:hypothetical protein
MFGVERTPRAASHGLTTVARTALAVGTCVAVGKRFDFPETM